MKLGVSIFFPTPNWLVTSDKTALAPVPSACTTGSIGRFDDKKIQVFNTETIGNILGIGCTGAWLILPEFI
jgi:hypothetical protein